ncbi:hypothetical protein RJZ56_004111 [Blastomyces dermatitidis]|uniref:Uncharacterized protein n=3 Tax=Blastomyces TaxID=229219 RepID=A0A179V2C0_BLAGS|nr:uncharacterized protein BDBG_09483 [Blastomyces gilchristii SLH14081]XP_031581459.1 hypothetical protein, variant 1 [Blastomyces gilchristii SLH14081]XP_031581460.1 hypothetical protein, variant 2 [Blastomyces gilchristii SLH14081]XP_045273829.1 hypothetical protein, variant 1 [Blastomyces dermatitidis ER-3]XP_045282970.1 uncharacterized protein BDCG_09507 [Blastomyces dermatitidis ER-3]XP_045282971.1 hypothetical protein, variant 2 [Blastomyces dermatitidis ER-3]EGE85333.1 hypothetical pr
MAELFIAIYQPRNQILGTYHWALYLQISSTEHIIFQIVGEPCDFKYDERSEPLEDSTHHIENIRVAEIDHVDHFCQLVRDQKIENEMYHWGCQQWVLDVLESLVEDDLLTDYDHDEAKLKLDPLFGVRVEDEYEA